VGTNTHNKRCVDVVGGFKLLNFVGCTRSRSARAGGARLHTCGHTQTHNKKIADVNT